MDLLVHEVPVAGLRRRHWTPGHRDEPAIPRSVIQVLEFGAIASERHDLAGFHDLQISGVPDDRRKVRGQKRFGGAMPNHQTAGRTHPSSYQ